MWTKTKKKRRNKMLWVYTIAIGIPILLTVGGFFFRKKISHNLKVFKFLKDIGGKFLTRKLATHYDLISGEKCISENSDVARITYKNIWGQTCFVQFPFDKMEARNRKCFVVILVRKRLSTMNNNEKDEEFINITQEPGVPYLLSANDLGGKELRIYASDTWYKPSFTLETEPLFKAEGKTLLPSKWDFSKGKEREVCF